MVEAIKEPQASQFDVIIIGAGISGIYQLYRLRELGFSVQVYEAGTGVGGTWYWNRYPGCRFDSESYSYGYSFSEEILQEWEWSEHFAAQPETLRYLNFVADKLDVRKNIQFNARVKSAVYNEGANLWTIKLEDGTQASTATLISATGPLSAPQMPAIEGVDSYQGESYHTALWPHGEDGFSGKQVDYANKRVGVLGTGATGVQLIQEVAKTAGELFVFQRRPNWCAPLHNSKIDEKTQVEIKSSYASIFAKCNETFGAFLHGMDERSALEVSDEEREAFFEKLYAEPGFGIWLGNFGDTLTDQKANDLISEFIAKKIRGRVKDPAIAEKLIPKDHGFGIRRVPMETNYYEVYNQDNVTLVDLLEAPIERITPTGIKTADNEYDLDILIYATGFDAVMGALNRIDITGVGGQKLKDKWADGPKTFLGMQTVGFPNLFTLVGPQNGSTFCNIPRCIEQNVDWLTGLLEYMRANNLTHSEPTADAETQWTEHVAESINATLFSTMKSWFMGFNDNIPGRDKPLAVLYAGGMPKFREKCQNVAEKGYPELNLE